MLCWVQEEEVFMPEMTALGWFHTVLGILALLFGVLSFVQHKLIAWSHRPGQIYLIFTLITALSALGIYNQGGFGIAHVLAVMTLGAVGVGSAAEKTQFIGKLSPYLQAVSYSATYLFHMIPAITDGLMRLPVGNPIVAEIGDPLLRGFYIAFLLAYLIGAALQINYLRGRSVPA